MVIDENFNSLHVIQKHLEPWGIQEDFMDALMIKSNGSVDVGSVVSRIMSNTEPKVYLKEYGEIARKALQKHEGL